MQNSDSIVLNSSKMHSKQIRPDRFVIDCYGPFSFFFFPFWFVFETGPHHIALTALEFTRLVSNSQILPPKCWFKDMHTTLVCYDVLPI